MVEQKIPGEVELLRAQIDYLQGMIAGGQAINIVLVKKLKGAVTISRKELARLYEKWTLTVENNGKTYELRLRRRATQALAGSGARVEGEVQQGGTVPTGDGSGLLSSGSEGSGDGAGSGGGA